MAKFNVGVSVALLPLSLYVLALGFGPILAAPLSETYGRKIVYLISPPLGAIFTLGAGFANNPETLIICRFFAGLFFSPSVAIGSGTLADIFIPAERGVATVLYVMTPFLGPALGPVIGAFVSVRKNWRWTQWVIIWFAIASWVPVLFMSETYSKVILGRRAKAAELTRKATTGTLRAMASITSVLTPAVKAPPNPIRYFITTTLLRPLTMLATEPIVLCFSLYIGFDFAVLYSFFAAFPYVFRKQYDFSREENGLVFLSIGTGSLLAGVTALICDKFFYQREVQRSHAAGNAGAVHPEHRLYAAMMGSLGLPISLFIFAFTARPSVHWIVPILAAVPFAWGNLLIFISASWYIIDTYGPMNGASAFSATGIVRYLLGCVFPLFTLNMYEGLGIDGATSLLAGVTVLLMPIPWVLFKYGQAIRGKSSYDTIKV
jgi:multidrug resistance protein